MSEDDLEAVLVIEEHAGCGDHIECTYRDGHFNITVDEPWAGDIETGFGQSTSIGLDRAQAELLRDWLSYHLSTPPLRGE
ncbi:hypothetical protein [Rhizorhabdus wittichii]|uniref:hypothetical protein n=1 Tax=Rhizorhabdus wittichii TaxID=160791 RepID=UPI0012FE0978|nr:hypothetical protein [Rhizorhabdus wittichii]